MIRPLENNSRPFSASKGEMIISEGPQQPLSLVSSGCLGHSAAVVHGSQQLTMHPVVRNNAQPSGPSRFMLDHTPTRGQGVSHLVPMTPISEGLPMMGPLFNTTPPNTPMAVRGEFTSPRNIQIYARLDGRRQVGMRVNRSHYLNNASHHNHVDVNRIRDGLDVRTTVRLQNFALFYATLAYNDRSCFETSPTKSTR